MILIWNICVNTNTLGSTTLLICRKSTFASLELSNLHTKLLLFFFGGVGAGMNIYICLISLKTWSPKLGIKVSYLCSGCLVTCAHSKKCGAYILKCLAVDVE